MNNKYDIAIIGAGIGGLVSAARLSSLGKKVIIIEKEPRAGGYLTEFNRGGYVFDASLHLLNGCAEGQYVHDVFKRCGIVDKLSFLKPKYLYRSIFPEHDVRIPQTDMQAYREVLSKLFPESANEITNLFEELSEIYHIVESAIILRKPSQKLLSYLTRTAGEIIDKHVKSLKLKALICQLWMYLGLPPSLSRAIDFCYPWFDYHSHGGFYLAKGSYEIVRALKTRTEDNGACFVFNQTVNKIAIDGMVCKSVSFGQNDEILCDEVVSNIDLKKTAFELIGKKRFSSVNIKDIDNAVPSISAFEIFLGLDADLFRLYPDDYEIFINFDYDLDDHYCQCLKNNASKAPFLITINSNINKFSAPSGKSSVTITMLAGYDYWVSGSKAEYQDKKQRMADILIDRASKIIPEIKSKVSVKSISTPMTFERYTDNSCGAIYGYGSSLNFRHETRTNCLGGIKNLYFASAWARQGSGVAKVLRSAEDAVERIAKNDGVIKV